MEFHGRRLEWTFLLADVTFAIIGVDFLRSHKLLVRKADGTWRPCGDFRRLNMVTVAYSYPLPNMLDFAGQAAGCTIVPRAR